jgi:hypothetical protein
VQPLSPVQTTKAMKFEPFAPAMILEEVGRHERRLPFGQT